MKNVIGAVILLDLEKRVGDAAIFLFIASGYLKT